MILIVYYSHSFGNTREVAKQIHQKFGGDMVEIELVEPYPDDFDLVVAMVGEERENNFRPEIKNIVADMSIYDVVFIGSPIWYGTASTPVLSFMEKYDFSGKTIIPFYTCGKGDEGSYVSSLKRFCPNSTFLPGFGNSQPEREEGVHIEKVQDYLDKLSF
jgi:flavodoxin